MRKRHRTMRAGGGAYKCPRIPGGASMPLFWFEQPSQRPLCANADPSLRRSFLLVLRSHHDWQKTWAHALMPRKRYAIACAKAGDASCRRQSPVLLSFATMQNPSALPVSLLRGALWRVQWQSPAEAIVPRACLRERDETLRGQILRLVSREIFLRAHLLEPVQSFPFQA
jgi:hypothetical protein